MSEVFTDEAWRLYRTALKERDTARAELDTLRLLTLELIRDRDQAQALARDCYELLCRSLRTEGWAQQDRGREVDELEARLRRSEGAGDAPAIHGDVRRDERCPQCGLRLLDGRSCLICSAQSEGR
jgi:hypothetical protein